MFAQPLHGWNMTTCRIAAGKPVPLARSTEQVQPIDRKSSADEPKDFSRKGKSLRQQDDGRQVAYPTTHSVTLEFMSASPIL
jgi:hypothetical protein